MASSEAFLHLQQYNHRTPLDGDQIRALCNALTSLKRILGEEGAIKASVYSSILRLLKAHVTPLPIPSPVTFAQVQAARLQLLAEKLLKDHKPFPPQLTAAIAQGLVSGFDPVSNTQIPAESQRRQLSQQQLFERNQIIEERKRLSERHNDFTNTRNACVNFMRARDRQQAGPDPDLFIPWEQRHFKITPPVPQNGVSVLPAISSDMLESERRRFLNHRVNSVVNGIASMLNEHHSGSNVLPPRDAALLETRIRHAKLLSLQEKMRQTVWDEHLTDRDSRRGSKGRTRTLKQLQREFEKVDRARSRQIEAEERDARRKRQAWLNAMVEHLNKFRSYHRDVVRRGMRAVTKAVLKHHEEVARNSSRAEREAEKARIQKLQDDDEEGYLELVRQTKNKRLLELLDQTDKYLKDLGAVVKEERAKSGVVEYENSREKSGTGVSYYEIAHAIKEDVREQSSLLVGGKLKAYQLQGIQWMVSLYNNRLNGILADEMGLGKTIQTLGLIAHLMETKDNPGPYLIIVPLSTISNWEMEFSRWAPAIRVVVFKGDNKARRKLFDQVIEKKSFNVCLVTYEYVVRGKNLLKRIEWQHIVIDEGHRIKNHESRLSSVLHAHYRSRNRLLLTGTPLQNSLTELWALMNFLLPNVFRSAESFESWFAAPFAQMGVGNVTTTDNNAQLSEEENLLIIRRLHQVLRPFLLRRLKSDVLRMGEQLPQKQEHVILVEMSAWQRFVYLKIVKSEYLLFTDKHGRQRYDKLSNPAVQLRKCVNHPYLFYADHASKLVDTHQLWRSSGKFDMLDAMVCKLLRTGHRILIFNQMTKVVDLQERLLRYRNVPFYRLDGTTSTEERKEMVNNFNDESTDVHVFLLTTRAGGLGVNLQTADTVIIFDSDWNPSMDQQAQDRAHRIGQRREVLVIRLLTNKSIEEDVMERASFKRGLEKKIIRAGMFDEQSKDSERQAMLRELLRVEGPGSDDDPSEDGLPTEEEVNRILARTEEEFQIFTTIDEERANEIVPRSRLMTDKEIPEWAVKVPKSLLQKARTSGAGNWAGDVDGLDLNVLNEPKKRRAATTNVSYGIDQLSERQYIKLVERSEAGEKISYDAVRAYTSRGKRRRKGETTKFDPSESGSERRPDSNYGVSGKKSRRRLSNDVIVSSKSLDTETKSADDDMTEGCEQSVSHAAVDDMIIEEEDEDDEVRDGRETADDDDEAALKDTGGSDGGNISIQSDGEVSEFSEQSESQSESMASTPERSRKRAGPMLCRKSGYSKRPRQQSSTPDVGETGQNPSNFKTDSLSEIRKVRLGESSDESPAPIRRVSRKRLQMRPTNLRSSPAGSNSQNDDCRESPRSSTKQGSVDHTARISITGKGPLSVNCSERSLPAPVASSGMQNLGAEKSYIQGKRPMDRDDKIAPLNTTTDVDVHVSETRRGSCERVNKTEVPSSVSNVVSQLKQVSSRRSTVTDMPSSFPLPKLSPIGGASRKVNNFLPSMSSVKLTSNEASRKSDLNSTKSKGILPLGKQPMPVLPDRASSSLMKRRSSPPKLPATFKQLSSTPVLELSNPPILPTSPRISKASSHFKRSSALSDDGPSRANLLEKKSSEVSHSNPQQTNAISGSPVSSKQKSVLTNLTTGTTPIAGTKNWEEVESEAEDGEIREDGELSDPKEDKKGVLKKSSPFPSSHEDICHSARYIPESGSKNATNRKMDQAKSLTPMRTLPSMVSRHLSTPCSQNSGPAPVPIGPRSREIVPVCRGVVPAYAPSMIPPGSRLGTAVINRPVLPPVGRAVPLPKRASIASSTIIKTMRPSEPPTSIPIITMPRLPPPSGMGPPPTTAIHLPRGLKPVGRGRGGIINHRNAASPMVPMGPNVAPYLPYGVRSPGYGGMEIYGPPGISGTGSKHGNAGQTSRTVFNGRVPTAGPPITTSMSQAHRVMHGMVVKANTSSALDCRISETKSAQDVSCKESNENVTCGDDKTASVAGHEKSEEDDSPTKKINNVSVKDVVDGEEGEIEEEGEIVES